MSIDDILTAIYEDQTWQTNLTDNERKQALKWGVDQLQRALIAKHAHVIGILRTINQLFKQDNINHSDLLRAVLEDHS